MIVVNKLFKTLQCFFLGIFIISFALTFVILCRPYFYLNVHLLELQKGTGYTSTEIKEAYDDVMDYLVFGDEFKTGVLPYSEEGKDHFQDCKKLFTLNFVCLFTSISFLIITLILQKTKKINIEFKKLSPGICTAMGIGIFSILLLIWGSIDFYSLFIVFHKVFFPGKTNWKFNPETDPIINILTSKVWINLAILVFLIIIILVSGIIIYEYYKKEELKKKTQANN